LLSKIDPNGNTISYDYDALNRLTNITYSDSSVAYIYDALGRQTTMTDTQGVTVYSYDALGRLLAVDGPDDHDTITYTYDANGSLTRKETAPSSDLANPTETVDYTYNLQNRLASATKVIGSITYFTEYFYNNDGIRLQKHTWTEVSGVPQGDDQTVIYHNDPQNHTGYNQVLEELNYNIANPDPAVDTPTSVTTYSIGDDIISQSSGGTTTYLLYDGHGSVRHHADSSGNLTEYAYDDGTNPIVNYNTEQYDAYGNSLIPQTTDGLGYAGEMWDSDIDHSYNRARWYNPSNGRWNRADPFAGNMQDPQSLHKYLYAHANPANGTDPSGQFTIASMTMANSIRSILSGLNFGLLEAASISAESASAGITLNHALLYGAAIFTAGIILSRALGLVSQVAGSMFNSLIHRVGRNAVKFEGRLLRGVAGDLKSVWNRSSKSKLDVELIGELGASYTGLTHKYTNAYYMRHPSGHGIDQVMFKNNKWLIVEAKGGVSELASGQMSRRWIRDKIKLIDASDRWLANELKSARRDGRLKGMVVRTAVKGNNAFTPRYVMKNWDDIGQNTWSGRGVGPK
ncbi:MAG: hypothetical protein IID32_05850, partial [Planctomycetes bacterium]|nr:hypothetical protein [Planctomycetota bacterium]